MIENRIMILEDENMESKADFWADSKDVRFAPQSGHLGAVQYVRLMPVADIA